MSNTSFYQPFARACQYLNVRDHQAAYKQYMDFRKSISSFGSKNTGVKLLNTGVKSSKMDIQSLNMNDQSLNTDIQSLTTDILLPQIIMAERHLSHADTSQQAARRLVRLMAAVTTTTTSNKKFDPAFLEALQRFDKKQIVKIGRAHV